MTAKGGRGPSGVSIEFGFRDSGCDVRLNPGTAATFLESTDIVRLFSEWVELYQFAARGYVLCDPFMIVGPESGEVEFGHHAEVRFNRDHGL